VSVLPGEAVILTTTVTNAGPEPATGVTLVDALPATVALSAPTTTTGTCTTQDGLSCELGTLAANASVSVTYVATPTAPAAFTSGAFVFGNQADPDSTNNSTVVTVRVINTEQESLWLPLIQR
jgi:uncharacterized repeat protein (TIGR01451 family)